MSKKFSTTFLISKKKSNKINEKFRCQGPGLRAQGVKGKEERAGGKDQGLRIRITVKSSIVQDKLKGRVYKNSAFLLNDLFICLVFGLLRLFL